MHMEKNYTPVTNTQELTEALNRCRTAQARFASYTQEQVDRIFLAAASAANKMRIPLAKQAVAETGLEAHITWQPYELTPPPKDRVDTYHDAHRGVHL